VSTFTANNSVLPRQELQLAPEGDSGPIFADLKSSFDTCVTNLSPYRTQTAQNYSTRFAIWPGQSADGKKHSRGAQGTPDPVPWDGASDLRVYLTDNLINDKVAMILEAINKASLVAQPVEGNDIKRAKQVSTFMRWMIKTQMPDFEREMELGAQYLEEKGAFVMGQFWETTQSKVLQELRLTDLQTNFPDVDIQQLLDSGDADDYLKSIFEEIYGVTRAKAAKMLKELTNRGITTVAIVGREKSYPVMRAFNLDTDLFIPPDTTDIEMATGIYRVQYYTPEKLRSLVNTDGWDKNWVENAIATCKGKMLSVTPAEYMQPMSRSFIFTQQRFTDKIGVVWAYQRLSDEDGVPGVYLTIFSPDLPPSQGGTVQQGLSYGPHKGYAKFSLYGDNDGKYPFVLYRREYLSRKLHDSRGLPEPLKPLQDTIKAHKDSKIDTASYNIMPTIFYPIGRPLLKWGAGARVPERRPNEYHYGQPIPYDETTESSLLSLSGDAKEYAGFTKPDDGQAPNTTKNQAEVNKIFAALAQSFNQVWRLFKKYGNEITYFRVVGVQSAELGEFQRGPEDEDFYFEFKFDLRKSDPNFQRDQLKWITDFVAATDRNGAADWNEIMQYGLESEDPSLASRAIRPAEVGAEAVIGEVQDDLTKLWAGIAVNLRPNTPPQLAMQVLQNWAQSPDVVARYGMDEAFKERVDVYTQQVEMAQDQINNKQIGRLGAVQPTAVIGPSAV
jgi:hypothetical protein